MVAKVLVFQHIINLGRILQEISQLNPGQAWSAQECKRNMGYVLERRAAEYFNSLNEWEPNLAYYDLIIRMEEFMQVQETSKPSIMTQYTRYVRQDFQTEQYRGPFVPIFSYENNQFANTIQVPQHNSPLVGAHCQKQERYILYKGHQNSSNSTIGTQSIDTNFVPSNGSTVKCTESIADAFTGTSSEDSTGIELDEEILGERLARLEKTFSHISDLANSQFSVQLDPYPQVHATSSNDTQASSLHGPQVSSIYGPQASSLHDPPASSLHDPRRHCCYTTQHQLTKMRSPLVN